MSPISPFNYLSIRRRCYLRRKLALQEDKHSDWVWHKNFSVQIEGDFHSSKCLGLEGDRKTLLSSFPVVEYNLQNRFERLWEGQVAEEDDLLQNCRLRFITIDLLGLDSSRFGRFNIVIFLLDLLKDEYKLHLFLLLLPSGIFHGFITKNNLVEFVWLMF